MAAKKSVIIRPEYHALLTYIAKYKRQTRQASRKSVVEAGILKEAQTLVTGIIDPKQRGHMLALINEAEVAD